MYAKKDKSRVWRLTGIFFAGMVLFTLLSRAVYQHGTAVVSTASPSGGTVSHSVRLTGKVLQNQDLAVTTVGGLRVKSVCVNEGQHVAQGDVLFTLDLDYLSETIMTQKKEMEKQKLSVQDAWSQISASREQRANAQAQAAENYDSAVSQAQTTLERAERDLERAKRQLKDFQNGVTDTRAQEQALMDACREAEADYDAAQTALEQLEAEIEREVQEAVENAKSDVTVPTETQAPSTEPPAPSTEPMAPSAGEQELGEEEEKPTPETQGSSPEEPSSASALPATHSAGPSQAELDAAAAAVRESYAAELSDAEAGVEKARQALDGAKADLEAYRAAQSSGGAAPTEEELAAAVEKAQERYDDALTALENAETVYGRAIRSAELPDGSDHSAQIGQITYDQMAFYLGKLEALEEAGGKVLAPVEGIVTSCNVQAGEKTTDTTAMLLADLSQGCKFSGIATEEQSKYIGVGDQVTLRADSTGKSYKDLSVTTFSATEEGDYRLTVQLPADTLTLGASAELSFTRKSQTYNCCVPLSALHLDEKNQAYVLVAEEVESVMGTQTQARKVGVTVLEQNDTTAALADGTLHREQKVIVSADRAVDAGSRVRVS